MCLLLLRLCLLCLLLLPLNSHNLAKVVCQLITDARQRDVLRREALGLVGCPADEGCVEDLPGISFCVTMGRGDKVRRSTLDHSGWWFLSLHCRDTAVMKSWVCC